METFFNPIFMSGFGLMQISIGDADMIETQRQAPVFNAGAQCLQCLLGRMDCGVSHEQ